MNLLKPLACLLPQAAKNAALIILNRPLEKRLLKQIWSCSLFRAVTDGASNRLYSCLGDERDQFIPDIITGDFDSATENVLNFYKAAAVPIMETPDQDETDFTKCLRVTLKKTESMPVEQIIVVGSVGGRVDHHFANINTLYMAATLTSKPVYLISRGSLACLLPPGKSVIHADTGLENKWCGLIPVGRRCDHVTTSGLKWNLEDQAMAFGELVSTSNTYSAGRVTVETDQPLLWTMGYQFPEETSD